MVPIDAPADIPAVTITGNHRDPAGLSTSHQCRTLNIRSSITGGAASGTSTQMLSGFFNTGAGGDRASATWVGVSACSTRPAILVGDTRGWAMPAPWLPGAGTPAPAPPLFNVSTLDATTPAVISVQQPRRPYVGGVHRWPDRDPHLPTAESSSIRHRRPSPSCSTDIGNAFGLGQCRR